MSNRKRRRPSGQRPRPPSTERTDQGAGTDRPARPRTQSLRGSTGGTRRQPAAAPARRTTRSAAPAARTRRPPPRDEDARSKARANLPSQPPVAVSLSRGLAAVGRSPVLLVTVFAGALLLWLAYSSTGVIRLASPGVMAQLESLPPVHSLLDVNFLLTAARALPVGAVAGFGVLLLVVRTAVSSFVLALVLAGFRSERAEDARPAAAARVALRAFLPMLAIEVSFLVAFFVLSRVLATVLGFIGLLGALILPMYFFVYAPIVLVAEGASFTESLRVGSWAARLPGRQHLLFTFVYVFLSILSILATGASPVVPATPGIFVWAFALFVNFLHVSVLAAFAFRWVLVRDAILTMPAEARPRFRWTLAPR